MVSNRGKQKGIALIAVLLLLVFVLTIVGGLFYRHQIHIQKVSKSLVGEQALLLLMSAESWAQSILLEDARSSTRDDYGENWGRNLPLLPIEGGVISGCLRDEQSLYSINSLGWYTNKSWEDELAAEQTGSRQATRRTIFRGLLQQLQLDASDARIASLTDWLDADSWLVSPESAEDNEYLLLDPPYRPANDGLVELSELSLVRGFSAADAVALAPYVNVLAEATPVNINTAPQLVLMALSPIINPSVAEAIVAARPFETTDQFYTALAGMAGETRQTLLADLPAELIAVNSKYFSLLADVELAGIHMRYTSLIERSSGQTARVLARTLRYIPPLADGDGKARDINSICAQMREASATP